MTKNAKPARTLGQRLQTGTFVGPNYRYLETGTRIRGMKVVHISINV